MIQEGLDAETISSLRKFWSDAAEVNFLTMKSLPWYWATEKFPLLAWARIQIGDLLPPNVSRCIYMDTDTLVGRDLVELFEMPLEEIPSPWRSTTTCRQRLKPTFTLSASILIAGSIQE